MKLLLTALSGSREGKVFTVEADECITFGRTVASHWSFEDDGHMSSVHFEVAHMGDYAEVRDRGSTNGTWLNNNKILTERLRDGDRLRAGKTVLTVEYASDVVPAELADPPGLHGADPSMFEGHSPPPAGAQDLANPIHGQSSARGINPFESFDGSPPRSDSPQSPTPAQIPPAPPPPRPPLAPIRSADSGSSKPINPFDSIDFVEQVPPPNVASGAVFSQPEEGEGWANNPISDSSFAFPVHDDSLADPPKKKGTEPHLQVFQRRTLGEAAEGLAIVLDSLAATWSIQVVLHFQKIRSEPPIASGQPLFTCRNAASRQEHAPLRFSWDEICNEPSVLALLPRLARADGCLAFVSRSTTELAKQLAVMTEVGIEGFSEPGGFLPVCWPSMFACLAEIGGVDAVNRLFDGRISGALWCSMWHPQVITSVGNSDLGADLVQADFGVSQDLRG